MTENVMMKKAYHVAQGEVLMYAVDAHLAVRTFPKEWSFQPWPAAEDGDAAPAAAAEPEATAEAQVVRPASRRKTQPSE